MIYILKNIKWKILFNCQTFKKKTVLINNYQTNSQPPLSPFKEKVINIKCKSQLIGNYVKSTQFHPNLDWLMSFCTQHKFF